MRLTHTEKSQKIYSYLLVWSLTCAKIPTLVYRILSLQFSPCNPVFAIQSLQFSPCNSVVAMRFSPCNSVLEIHTLQFSPCNSVIAMRFIPCNAVLARQVSVCNSDNPYHSGHVRNTAPTAHNYNYNNYCKYYINGKLTHSGHAIEYG